MLFYLQQNDSLLSLCHFHDQAALPALRLQNFHALEGSRLRVLLCSCDSLCLRLNRVYRDWPYVVFLSSAYWAHAAHKPNLLVVTGPRNSALWQELRDVTVALRRVREPLIAIQVLATDSPGLGDEDDMLDPSVYDETIECPAQGYDIFPFLEALRQAHGEEARYVTKLHTKSHDAWRQRLLKDVFHTRLGDPPQFLCNFTPSDTCVNTACWKTLVATHAEILPEPEPCRFVPGTMWTMPLECLRPHITALLSLSFTKDMRTGADGQVEHVLERYFGFLAGW